MRTTTPDEARAWANKHGGTELHFDQVMISKVQLAALIDEVRGVDAEPVGEVERGPLNGFGYATMVVTWKKCSENLPLGVLHKLYTHPAPSQPADSKNERCPVCGEDEPFTGTCGAGDRLNALCKRQSAAPNIADWGIDTSTGRAILIYRNCSVIEDEQAKYVLDLITAQPAAPVELPVVAWLSGNEQRLTFGRPNSDPKQEALVKLSDAQAAIAAGRKTS